MHGGSTSDQEVLANLVSPRLRAAVAKATAKAVARATAAYTARQEDKQRLQLSKAKVLADAAERKALVEEGRRREAEAARATAMQQTVAEAARRVNAEEVAHKEAALRARAEEVARAAEKAAQEEFIKRTMAEQMAKREAAVRQAVEQTLIQTEDATQKWADEALKRGWGKTPEHKPEVSATASVSDTIAIAEKSANPEQSTFGHRAKQNKRRKLLRQLADARKQKEAASPT